MIQTAADYIAEMGQLSLQEVKQPIHDTVIYGLIRWCRDYERATKFPVDVLKRFAIGIYQIHQGIDWKDQTNRNESFAAAALHFMMVSERLELKIDEPYSEIAFTRWPRRYIESEALALLRDISKAQQQLFYADKANKTKRRDRYNPAALATALSMIFYRLTCCIAPEHRSDSFHLAMTIMTKLN